MAGFPENVIDALKPSFDAHLTDHKFIPRPLRFTDPERSLGIYALQWNPEQEDSAQIGQMEPALARYQFRIQNLIKAADEVEGRGLYTASAKIVRAILYRDPALRVRLCELSEEVLGSVERVKRYGVRAQGYLNNELRSQFVYLATTDMWVETEVTQL
jgi:hypothetical protein